MLGTAVVCGLVLLAPAVAHADIRISDASAGETNGTRTATFTITRDAGLLAPARVVTFATADGGARAGVDYEAVSGTVAFGAAPLGAMQTQPVTVVVRDDALDESDETFRVLISAAGEAITDGEGIGTIADDDPLPTVAVADAPSVGESAARASFEVRLSALSGLDVAVSYATADGSAKAGEDYAASSGRLTIPAGARAATVDVALKDDAAQEPAEAFVLGLSAPSSATLGDREATATIDDDDAPGAPATGSSAASAGGGTLAGGTRLGLGRLRLRRPATVLISVSCPAPAGRCSGRLTLSTMPKRRARIAALRSERRLGRRSFVIDGGRASTLQFKLRRSDRELLRRARTLRVRAYAVVQDATGRAGVRQLSGKLSRAARRAGG